MDTSQQQNTVGNSEQRMTKRERREMQKQERMLAAHGGRGMMWLWWVLGALVVGGVIWAMSTSPR